MPDDRTQRGAPDRNRVLGTENYEVEHFAKHHGLTHQQAYDLIATYGNSRKELVAAVSRMKTAG